MAAPIAQIDVEKVWGAESWTNRWLVDVAPDDPSSGALIDCIVEAERAMTYNVVRFTRARHATLAPNDADYHIEVINLFGLRNADSQDLLPLFCVARIDFHTTGGRPSRKYMRGTIAEQDNQQGFLAPIFAGSGADAFIAGILACEGIVDPQGDTFLSGAIAPAVGMRQLRRGSKRRETPALG